MDFRQITQPNNGRPAAPAAAPDDHERRSDKNSGAKREKNWPLLFNGIMLIGVAALVAVLAIALMHTDNKTNAALETKYVSSSKYQAVFLSNGQVYFGNIASITDNSMRMTNVYYLTQNSDSSSSDYSLIKLGCQQIHDPYDEMVINRDQVTFWENLQDDGKVVSSIKEFKKQNPNGPDCSKVSTQTQADSSATTQGAATKK